MSILINDHTRAGQAAARAEFFGPRKRFSVVPIHTRFAHLSWFVMDHETMDELDLPSVVGQCSTRGDALNRVAILMGWEI